MLRIFAAHPARPTDAHAPMRAWPAARAFAHAAGTLRGALMLLLSLAATPEPKAQTTDAPIRYRLEMQRSSVAFVLDIVGHSHLTMRFREVEAELSQPPERTRAPRVSVTIAAASVDAHAPFAASIARSRAVLDVARYPSIQFISRHFVRTGIDTWTVTGDLTIRATTRPVTLDVAFQSQGRDMSRGAETLSFSAKGHFSRTAFGLSRWPSTVGDDVRMTIRAEFVRVPIRR